MSSKLAPICLTVVLLASACSEEPSSPSALQEERTRTTTPDRREEKSDSKKRSRKDDGARSRSDTVNRQDRATGSNGGRGPFRSRGGGGSVTTSESAAYPAAGTYTFAQRGYEEFCQTTSCDRQSLPARQSVEMSYRSRSASEAVVVSEAQASGKRLTRTTFRFTSKHAFVTDVYTRFTYQNVRFEDSYRPDPPVDALRFPLMSGRSWSGRWKDKTSGSYDISVGPREDVQVAGQAVSAFRIDTSITFKGQFEGSSTAVVWFDPSTKSVVKSEGEMDLRSAFGRYRTEFSTTLESGPGY